MQVVTARAQMRTVKTAARLMTVGRRPSLYLDLDGVLADFETGVVSLCGKRPIEFKDQTAMWKRLARADNFYGKLKWMKSGPRLWDLSREAEPTILTGLPRGKWAEPQKREWCAKHLGPQVPVITCMARDKAKLCTPGDILIDDRLTNCHEWRSAGGIAFHWTDKNNSSSRNQELLFSEVHTVLAPLLSASGTDSR